MKNVIVDGNVFEFLHPRLKTIIELKIIKLQVDGKAALNLKINFQTFLLCFMKLKITFHEYPTLML